MILLNLNVEDFRDRACSTNGKDHSLMRTKYYSGNMQQGLHVAGWKILDFLIFRCSLSGGSSKSEML